MGFLEPGQQLVTISRELTPLEEASLQNQKLKTAYEARMARLDPSQATQKTSLVSSLRDVWGWSGRGSGPYSPPASLEPVSAAADDGEPGDRQGPGADRILLAHPQCPAG